MGKRFTAASLSVFIAYPCLVVCLSFLSLSVCLFVFLFVCLSISACLSAHLYCLCLCVCSFCLSVCLLAFFLSVCLFVPAFLSVPSPELMTLWQSCTLDYLFVCLWDFVSVALTIIIILIKPLPVPLNNKLL